MRDILRLVVVLAVISAVASGSLALVNSFTEPRITAFKAQAEAEALQQVLPEADRFTEDQKMMEKVKSNPDLSLIKSIKAGSKNGVEVGWVCKVLSPGYSSNIGMLVGINAEGKLQKVLILEQNETPGLGTKTTDPKFIEQKAIYENDPGQDLKVTKDGGTVQAVTGATISSRAVLRGINQVLALIRPQNA